MIKLSILAVIVFTGLTFACISKADEPPSTQLDFDSGVLIVVITDDNAETVAVETRQGKE